MPKDRWIALAGGIASAAASMAFLSGAPGGMVFVYSAPLPLFLVGLAFGPKAVTVAGITGLFVTWASGDILAMGLYGATSAIPAWLVVQRVMMSRPAADGGVEWYPVGSALSWLALLGTGMVLAAAFPAGSGLSGSMDTGQGLEALIIEHLDGTFAVMLPSLPDSNRETIVGLMAPIFPGVMGVIWVAMTILNGSLAQAILVRLERNLRPTPSFAGLTLPDWASWPLVGAAALALVGSGEVEYLARNAAIILSIPFFMLGLAVVHTLIRRMGLPGIVLTGFYLILLVFSGASLLIAGIGIVEQWVGLRRRLTGPGNGQEEV